MNSYPPYIVIEEQGLRDGLQSEKRFVPTEKKLEMIGIVADAGIKRIQVTSFVNPKRVPQMADAEDVCKGLDWSRDALYSALVLNAKGLERAADAGLRHVRGHVGGDEAGSDRVAADAPAAKFLGHRLGEGDDAGLGGGVIGLPGIAGQPYHR